MDLAAVTVNRDWFTHLRISLDLQCVGIVKRQVLIASRTQIRTGLQKNSTSEDDKETRVRFSQPNSNQI